MILFDALIYGAKLGLFFVIPVVGIFGLMFLIKSTKFLRSPLFPRFHFNFRLFIKELLPLITHVFVILFIIGFITEILWQIITINGWL